MKAFSTKRIKVASKTRASFDLSSRVISTNDFGNLTVNYCREVVPGDKFSGNVKSFCRLAPMPVPTFANIKMIQHCYYVKARSCWKPFDDFYAGRKTYYQGTSIQYNEVPHITNDLLFELFNTVGEPDLVTSGDAFAIQGADLSNKVYDFLESDGTDYYPYTLTTKGKRLYNLLRSVGINFNYSAEDKTKISIMPLLAYARIFYDYYLPKRYSNVNKLRYYLTLYSWTTAQAQQFINDLADFMNIFYDDDYFTSSWETPNSPVTEQQTYGSVRVIDPNNNLAGSGSFAGAVFDPNYGSGLNNPYGNDGISELNGLKLSQFGISALKAVYDYGMRKGLAGNKYFDAIFSQFGIQLPELTLDVANHLGSSVVGALLQDVTATAQTDNNGSITALGDFAGKGHLYDDSFNVNFTSNDFGYLIITSHIIPDVGYVQGLNKENQHITRLQFFNPEFDKLGMQALAEKELYNSFTNGEDYRLYSDNGVNTDQIFGYTPRYSEYKVGRDLLSGDFAIKSIGTDDDAYHTFRIFNDKFLYGADSKNNMEFRILNPALQGSNFDRIFNDTNLDVDHFICSYNINMSVQRKMSSLQDSLDLDGSDVVNIDVD